MRIVVDKNIPYIKGVLEPFFEVIYAEGNMTFEDVEQADVIIIRTRTTCDQALLERDGRQARVKFIASATIGTDHIDMPYLKSKGIKFAYAPGCNAAGVMQYVFTSLFTLAEFGESPFSLKGKTLGVIGVGNTGSRVADFGEHLGFKVLRNDPPKAALEVIPPGEESIYCSLEEVIESADIISLHLPLDDGTAKLVSKSFLSKVKKNLILINSSRGGVIDDQAVLDAGLKGLVLDVWNGEPDFISEALLAKADIATPHIAGYSKEGKINGTQAVINRLGEFYGIEELKSIRVTEREEEVLIDFEGMNQRDIAVRLQEVFPIMELDKKLRTSPEEFEEIRKKYDYRREFVWKK